MLKLEKQGLSDRLERLQASASTETRGDTNERSGERMRRVVTRDVATNTEELGVEKVVARDEIAPLLRHLSYRMSNSCSR